MLLDSVFVFEVWTLIIWTDALVLTLACLVTLEVFVILRI